MTKWVTTDSNGRSAWHTDRECYCLQKEPRKATAREVETLKECPHCSDELTRDEQDWSYQKALRRAADADD